MKFISITPENNNAAEFMEVISKMPAFVKLYSPTCGHCVAMQKAWDALKNHAELKNYEMAVIEVHADEIDKINSPAMAVNEGFPTIRKVLKNGNLGKDYNGNRSTADMITFIKENFSEAKKGKHNSPSKHKSPSHNHANSYMKGGGKRKKTRKNRRRKTQRKTKSRRRHKR